MHPSDAGPGGQDGEDIRAAAAHHLEYLSELAEDLGVVDLVETYFDPLVGRWSDMHAEAERWRVAGEIVGHVSEELGKPLGTLDAGWEGKDADAFVAYIGKVGIAGGDAEDALKAMADALDETASGIQQIVRDMADLLMDTAEVTSESASLPVGGEARARAQLAEAKHSVKALFESARDVLESFARFCDQVEDGDPSTPGVEMAHRYPEEKFLLEADRSSTATSAEAPTSSDSQSTEPAAADATTEPAGDRGEGDDSSGAPGAAGSQLDPGHQTAAAPIPGVVVTNAEPGVASTSQAKGAQAAVMGGMMPMMGMGAASGGGDREHKVKPRIPTQPEELFGKPEQVAVPLIGTDPEKPRPARGG